MFRKLLADEFAPYGALSAEQLDMLERHYRLLCLWNQKLNLTRITKPEDVVRLHYCESLFLARSLPAGRLRIADVGSGAGFPGIPVAVYRPDCSVDMIESHQRKVVFLSEAVRNLPNARVLAKRAEACDAGYDWVVSRAVRPSEIMSLGLGKNIAVLTSSDVVLPTGAIREKVPWGRDRILAMFHVEHAKI